MVELVSSGLTDLVPMIRSDGKHVSNAIRKLCIQFGHFEDTPFPQDKTRMEMGSAFEDMLALQLGERLAANANEPERWTKVGEQECDGVFGTPDFADLIELAVREVKLTWLSIRHDPDDKKFWKYWAQIKAYCYMMGLDTGYLHIGHIMGNYMYDELTDCPWCTKFNMPQRTGNGPHFHTWKKSFSQSELHDNWAMIRAYA